MTKNFPMKINKTFSVNMYSKTNLLKCIIVRVPNPLFDIYGDPLILLIPPPASFSNFVEPLTLPSCFFCCLVSLTEWMIVPHLLCHFSFHDIMDLHMTSLGTLVPQGLCSAFYATRHQFTEF